MKKLILALICAATLFTSCASSGGTVMSFGSAKVSEAEYKYWMATYKARYISAYTDIQDSAAYWSSKLTESSEVSNEELVNGLIRQNIKTNLVAMGLFAENGLTLSDEKKDEIDEYIDSMVDELADGSRKTLNAELAEFGVNINTLRNIFINEQKVTELYDYYYGDNGATPLTDAQRNEYYENNYVRFVQINVNDAFVYEEDEDGTYIQNTDGSYKTRDLNDEEKAEKNKKIAEIEALIAEGNDIEELYSEYSENTSYPNGYYFSSATAANYVGEIVTQAFKLGEGEWTKVVSEKYGTFFIKRLPLDEGAYASEENSDFFGGYDDTVKQDLYDTLITSHFEEITVDEKLLNAVSVADIKANYSYY